MLKLTETDKAYLAAFIDTDGSIQIVRATNHYNKKSRRIYHQLRLQFFNTNFEGLQEIKNRVGYGNLSKRNKKSDRHKQPYAFVLTALKALEVLKAIYPYMILKRKQAEVAFIFGQTIRDKLNNRCGRNGLEDSVIALRESCKVAMNALNGNNGGHKLRLWKK